MKNAPSTKLEWALWAVEHTPFYVFPLRPNSKKPLYQGAGYDGTRDPEKIRAWWAITPEANPGYAYFLSGHSLIECDIKDPLNNGYDKWLELWRERGEEPPETLTWISRSGGPHYIFTDPEGYLKTDQAVWPGIDTRGVGGLGVGPGGTFDGKMYSIGHIPVETDGRPHIAPLPAWIREAVGGKTFAERQDEVRTASPLADGEWDRRLSIEYARDAIRADLAENGDPRMGGGSDGRAIEVCQRLLDFALTDSTVLDLLKEEWQPSFDRDWYRTKLDNAHRYRQNDVGCDRPIGGAEAFQDALDAVLEGLTDKRRRKYAFRTPEEAANAPPLTYWDELRSLPRVPGGCAIIAYGPMSSHKTGVVLKYCLDAAIKGCLDEKDKRRYAKVLYLAPEGAHGINTARLPAAVAERGKGLKDLYGLWYTFSTAPGLMVDSEVQELIEACAEADFKPDIVVVDTLTRAARGFDISAPQTGVGLVTGMELLAAAWDAAVIAVTHPGKDSNRGSIGSSLVESLAYAVWHITSPDDASVTLSVEKMKDGPQGFHLGFDINREQAGVPVITGGKIVEKREGPGRPTRRGDWEKIRNWAIEQLRCIQEPWITTGQLADLIDDAKQDDEDFESWQGRKTTLQNKLHRGSEFEDGPYGKLVQRTRAGIVDRASGSRWLKITAAIHT